jgi:LPS sulfotransferase NodH
MRSAPVRPGPGLEAPFADGSRLVFILGPFRAGTTLLRKMLDSHPALCSPAETWFLLPLLNLWDGQGSAAAYNPAQAGAAIRQHLGPEQFLACCRAFAATFYASIMPPRAELLIDKTPLYLGLAPALPVLFPRARFIALSRDPRGLCWSRHTWAHARQAPVESLFAGVADDLRRLGAFFAAHPTRTLHLTYERLCRDPRIELAAICEFLGVAPDPAMIDYGRRAHHEGYGDENTRAHDRPHIDSLDRWRTSRGLSAEQEARLLAQCGPALLAALGVDGIESAAEVGA